MDFTKVTQLGGRAKILLGKHSPEILIFGGVIGMVGATVLACKATTKFEEVKAINETDISKTKDENLNRDSYKRELTFAYVRCGYRMVKLYSPAILMGGMSISAILSGHSILRKRNLAITAAYSALDEGYRRYRGRVIEELGEEADRRFKHGGKIEEFEIVETDENGKEKKKKIKAENIQMGNESQYARFFDAGSIKWTKDPSSNLFVLKQMERFANERLQAKGHLFLNEVYDMLDIPRTQDGSVVGWLYDGDGDGYVSFGIYDKDDEAKRRFVNGYESVILLDFNVDGIIYDKI